MTAVLGLELVEACDWDEPVARGAHLTAAMLSLRLALGLSAPAVKRRGHGSAGAAPQHALCT